MIFKQVMPYVDFFVPSIEEICALLEPERYQDWQLRAGEKDIPQILDFEKDIQPVADACMSLGVKVLLLKCGTLGLYLQTAGKDEVCKIGKKLVFDNNKWSNLSLFEKPYLPSKVRSATGAGDTCIAAFLTGILNNESPDICLKLAAGCGACCVEEYDALSGLVTYEELKKKINSDWKKLY